MFEIKKITIIASLILVGLGLTIYLYSLSIKNEQSYAASCMQPRTFNNLLECLERHEYQKNSSFIIPKTIEFAQKQDQKAQLHLIDFLTDSTYSNEKYPIDIGLQYLYRCAESFNQACVDKYLRINSNKTLEKQKVSQLFLTLYQKNKIDLPINFYHYYDLFLKTNHIPKNETIYCIVDKKCD